MDIKNTLIESIAKVAVIVLLILLIPFTASFMTDEMAWSLYDYVLAGVMLFGTGSAYVLLSSQSGSMLYKVAVGLALASALFLAFANIAVGILGSEDNAINLFYFLIVLLLVIGSFIARFQPRGMAVTLFTTALAQALMIPVALIFDMQNAPGSSFMEIILLNGGFVTLFVVSGILFLLANKKQPGQLSTSA